MLCSANGAVEADVIFLQGFPLQLEQQRQSYLPSFSLAGIDGGVVHDNIRLHFIPVHLLQEVDSVLPVTGLGKGADCVLCFSSTAPSC